MTQRPIEKSIQATYQPASLQSFSDTSELLARLIGESPQLRQLYYQRLCRINELPIEILSNIFKFAFSSLEHPHETVVSRLALTWVCRRWRHVMLEDMAVWSSIWIRDAPPHERSLAWLDRAGTAPLDIRIDWKVRGDDELVTHRIEALLDQLFIKLSQIRTLIIILDNWPSALTTLQKLDVAGKSGQKITLERFELHRSGNPYVWIDTQSQAWTPNMLLGGQTSALTYFCMNGIPIDWNRTPIYNLTTLDLRRLAMESLPSLKRFRQILLDCPRLYKLSLDGAGPALEVNAPRFDPIVLPHLEVLVLGNFSLYFASYVVPQFLAPNVRDLTLMNLSGENYSPLFDMMVSRFPKTRVLTLYGVDIGRGISPQRTLVRFLASMPQVGYLRIANLDPNFLDILSDDPSEIMNPAELSSLFPGGNCILYPNLCVLEFQVMAIPDIIQFVRMRREMKVPIDKIYVSPIWCSNITAEECAVLSSEAQVSVAPLGSRTLEEELLMGDD
ncbi:hypothetical protein CONPUDRAFT_46237 [Coniophora puteana RWD-64-598 SS2]|uniref:Uncharacterized protein n=1 Tax=Coniophora puteana (strain RWD-64-598) TaxID=741705 RepID=A0A5M3N860_CONPW|nr:uncharacterized protein CONPUDRAFT_46237 [Coniophora puteana RWD-64-598 SS2]EIW87025.1 hypothetical protein CONPUDRAFT_46237 [Coniophora puteana RWD-64-598 SS2]